MEELKKKIIEFLNNQINCEAIVIFGSFARGTQNDESDVDIAIKSQDEISKKELYEISNKLSDELKRDVDLVNLEKIENDGFKYEILINGEVVYCKDSYKFDLYKLDAYREYLELNESRKAIIDEMKK
jgi:predicted nucleotidyltransferase